MTDLLPLFEQLNKLHCDKYFYMGAEDEIKLKETETKYLNLGLKCSKIINPLIKNAYEELIKEGLNTIVEPPPPDKTYWDTYKDSITDFFINRYSNAEDWILVFFVEIVEYNGGKLTDALNIIKNKNILQRPIDDLRRRYYVVKNNFNFKHYEMKDD
jgi:hypothetical protein